MHWLFKPSSAKSIISKARVALGLRPLNLAPKGSSSAAQPSMRGMRYPSERYAEIDAAGSRDDVDDDDAKFGYSVRVHEYAMRDLEGAKRYR